MEKIRYDSEYISYVENGDSSAVFIIRDIVTQIDTNNKWVDVIDKKGQKNKDSKWDFSEITVEIFPRKIKPFYPEGASDEEKKYITWETANRDIGEQRKLGHRGPKYKVYPKLVNRNAGKTKTVKKVWNKTFQRYVPWKWKNSSCEIREVKVPEKPDWIYKIVSVKKL